ncbi:response regulator transcription factor [Paenibacillus macquariensis]|uniref:DNA-binding response regulator, OmpR family, contains REC and winged-helix (WHTH) domain n=1 Tax=Paenibacillus macquariensis TaxID=948756 RepID=A0ABY1KIN1_9BACL|nr:response regulator transcription factor [Paenibacillus macquariensis]MEC0093160.1 response regulator transcription factor [Paenibacillus macquariensis]OAB34308.1 DNA-binding response regulator [Paenibacillus macquariensis subsp. macquariensis]SIR73460.1 DNA-binding response regulator, OmpR family, contains REC and winged-helix (wHTH) domain [Paenibacillus macquariensis]
MADILVVEDEEAINELIRRNLSLVGHTCYLAMDGEAAVEMIKNKSFDLIVLDIMLPEMDGFEVLEQVKGTPTILLTAKRSVEDRVKGLVMGADDYLTKPFEMLELFARVEAILRRTKKDEDTFVIDNARVEFHSRRLFLEEKVVEYTPKEFELLEVLIRNRNIALSREKLLELVWGYEYIGETRTVDVHIQKLRKKLGLEKRIVTVYKLGYRLEV